MSTFIRIVVTLRIEPGKKSEFIEMITKNTIGLEANEPRTRGYEWYMGDNDKCIVIETYDDSEAIFEHMANTRSGILPNPVPELASVEEMRVFGSPNDKLKEALTARRDAKFFDTIAFFYR